MPQNPFVVATKSPSAEVFIFDVSRHPSIPESKVSFRPDQICHGHAREGYGLSWNPHTTGTLLSGSDDSSICMWDVNVASRNIESTRKWNGHSDVVEDVAWHSQSPHIFCSVGDDRMLLLWDIRRKSNVEPTLKVVGAHTADINAVSFNPLHEYLLVTGSADTCVKLWDLRNTSRAVYSLIGHEEEVFQVEWAPFDSSVLATCGSDRRVRIWDVGKIGAKQSCDLEHGPPELLFLHGGHTTTVSDVSWNEEHAWTLSSVSEDNILQIWKPV